KDEKTGAAKSRTFEFTYGGTVKDLKPGSTAKVWLPIAGSSPMQDVTIVSKDVPSDAKLGTEKTYGNQMLYFEGKAGKDGTLPFKIVYKVTRKEVTTGAKGTLTLKPTAQEDLKRFLAADSKVPVGGSKTMGLLGKKEVPQDQFAAAKLLYD